MEGEIAKQSEEASTGKLGTFLHGHFPHDGLLIVQGGNQEN
jgi:hypothetical protein